MALSGSSFALEAPQENTHLRVLVVDDSRLQRKILSASSERWGYRVEQAEPAEEALTKCKYDQPDLAISDWMMPNVNGMEWNFVRPFGICHATIVVILLTSKVEKLDVVRGLEIGADDFLTKPVNASELHARIIAGRRIIEMHRVLTEQNTVMTDRLAELCSAHAAIDQDLQQARKIQQVLVPGW